MTASVPRTPTWWIRRRISARCPIATGASSFAPLPLLLLYLWWAAVMPLALSGQTAERLPPSAPSDARTAFAQGLAALHLFEYEDANDAFRRARTVDPGQAMAYWGEAL